MFGIRCKDRVKVLCSGGYQGSIAELVRYNLEQGIACVKIEDECLDFKLNELAPYRPVEEGKSVMVVNSDAGVFYKKVGKAVKVLKDGRVAIKFSGVFGVFTFRNWEVQAVDSISAR